MHMVGSVVQQFVPRSWGVLGVGGVAGMVGGGTGLVVGGIGLGSAGAGGMTAGGLSSPPVHGVVGGGMEGLSLVCESPRVSRKSSGAGAGSGGWGGSGGLMWSAEGGRQLETWRVGVPGRFYKEGLCIDA